MESNKLKKGLLFTADPYSKIINYEDKSTSLLFGDGATVSLLSDHPNWEIGRFTFGTKGSCGEAIRISEKDGKLVMNGREVFAFSATMVPDNISKVLTINGLKIEDIDLFALHQGSKYIIKTVTTRLGVDESKIPFVATNYGNTVSSSIPMILEHLSNRINKVLMSGFGVGLSWASTILTRINRVGR